MALNRCATQAPPFFAYTNLTLFPPQKVHIRFACILMLRKLGKTLGYHALISLIKCVGSADKPGG
jgi:hypothetical protein